MLNQLPKNGYNGKFITSWVSFCSSVERVSQSDHFGYNLTSVFNEEFIKLLLHIATV